MGYIILLIFILCQLSGLGQTIQKFLVNDYRLNDTTITEVLETKTYFEKSGTNTYKRTYYYNSKGFVMKTVGLDTEGKLSTRLSYTYDNFDNLTQIKDEKWNVSMGYSLITTNFYFDSLSLLRIETIGNDGNLESRSYAKTENRLPVKLTSYDRDSLLIGYEIAEYIVDKNEVSIKVYNSQGIQIGKKIDLKLKLSNDSNFEVDGVLKNKLGDIIQEVKPECLSCDQLVTFKYEYKYDGNNNWTNKVTFKDDGFSTEKILRERRNIKYKNPQANRR